MDELIMILLYHYTILSIWAFIGRKDVIGRIRVEFAVIGPIRIYGLFIGLTSELLLIWMVGLGVRFKSCLKTELNINQDKTYKTWLTRLNLGLKFPPQFNIWSYSVGKISNLKGQFENFKIPFLKLSSK